MIKRYLVLFSALMLVLSSLEGCILKKNRCDSCPGVARHKKVRGHNRGSI